MTRIAFSGAVLLLLLAFAVGCSDGTDSATSSSSPFLAKPVTQYFPIAPDFGSVMMVKNPDGRTETVTYQFGNMMLMGGHEAYPWIEYDSRNNASLSYLVAVDSALFLYEYAGAQPQKLLDLPLVPGATWDRFDAAELTQSSDVSDPTDPDAPDYKDPGTQDTSSVDPGGDGDPQLSPGDLVTGGREMMVTAIETIELNNGLVFSGAVRIRNVDAYGNTNHYWFVPGVGLAKYVLGVSTYNPYDGNQVGEIVDYGFAMK